MKWYQNDGRSLIYGPKTTQAFCLIVDLDYLDHERRFLYVDHDGQYSPLRLATTIDQYNLMTNEIRKELEDYIFVDI